MVGLSPQGTLPGLQAVSLARRMAGKKGAVVQLQAEINSEDDWNKLLVKEGLIVVDVYSDWCGPCVGMVGNLKKCKLEIGGDMLHLAIAKSDEIDILKRFRNKSEPTWMFIAGGQLVNVMFGANAPKLMQMIESELKNELKVLKGEQERKWYPFDQLTPIEQERFEASERLRIAEEKAEAARRLAARNEDRNRRFGLMQHVLLSETVVLCMPHTVTHEGCVMQPMMEPIWPRIGVTIVDICKTKITYDMWEEIFYREGEPMTDDMAGNLEIGPAMALHLRTQAHLDQPTEPDQIERLVCEALNEVSLQPNQERVIPNPSSIPGQHFWKKPKIGGDESSKASSDEHENEEREKFITTTIPGLYTPPTALAKCAALSQLFPARAEKVAAAAGAPQLPPRIAMVFELGKAEQCYTMAQEMASEVVAIGFFDKGDPDEATLLARTQKHYSRLPQLPEHRLIVVVAKRRSEPELSFSSLGPLYVSPDDTVGAMESDKFFPPGLDLDPEIDYEEDIDVENQNECEDDEDEENKSFDNKEGPFQTDEEDEDEGGQYGRSSEVSEGGLTPATAVNDTQ